MFTVGKILLLSDTCVFSGMQQRDKNIYPCDFESWDQNEGQKLVTYACMKLFKDMVLFQRCFIFHNF